MKTILTLFLLGLAGAAHCAPYVPKDDALVLERLPGRRDDPTMAELRVLRAAGCSAYVQATTGKTREAYEQLSGTLRRHPEALAEAKLWTLTRLAEMAWRLEDHAAADRLFNQALALGLDDNFLLAAYAD